MSPRFSVNWRPDRTIRYFATAGLFHPSPRFLQLAANESNTLENEQITHGSFGVEYFPNNNWSVLDKEPGKGEQQILHALGAAPIRALIVEDNRDICENIAAYLEKHSYILDFAYDGISTMHLALTIPFDVIAPRTSIGRRS